MSTTPKQESTHISPSEDSKVPLQENQTLLQIKRERDEADEQRCQECGLEDKDKILSFALSNKLMTFIYENVLNPGIDNQIKNDKPYFCSFDTETEFTIVNDDTDEYYSVKIVEKMIH